MKNFGVYDYETKELLGDFLSIASDYGEVKVYYLSADGLIIGALREKIEIKELNLGL